MVPMFLAELRSRDVHLWADGDRLRCTAPAGVLTPELRGELQRRKDEILHLLRSADELAKQQRSIVPLQPRGHRDPVFAVPGHNGDVFCYRSLAQELGNDQPFFGLQPPGVESDTTPLATVEALASHFAAQIKAFRGNAPLVLAGYCAGGTIAYELARQLTADGIAINFVALIASPYPSWYRRGVQMRFHITNAASRAVAIARMSWPALRAYMAEKMRERAAQSDPILIRRAHLEHSTVAAVSRYRPQPFAGRVVHFVPGDRWLPTALPAWQRLTPVRDEFRAPEGCSFDQILREPHVSHIAQLFRVCADRGTGARPKS